MSDLNDFTQKNRKHTGASGIKVSNDGLGDGDRVNEKGRLRFNDSTDLLEYYNGSAWKSIDAPPVITSFAIDGGSNVTSGEVDNEGGGTVSIAINGSLFDTTGATVTAVGGAETLSTTSLTRNNANLLTAVFTEADFDIGNSPYTIKVTNGSGLSAEIADALTADSSTVTFTNAVDTTVSLFDSARGVGISAADLCGTTGGTAHSVTTGSLPSGLSMTSATGAITGTASAVGSDTTSTFTVTATADDASVTRQFKITVKAPSRTTITSTGAGNFSVPTGVTSLSVLMVAGGGTGGSSLGSGGGGGGMLEGSLTVSPGSTIAYNVGAGGNQSQASDYHSGYYGANTTFGPVPGPGATATAVGGGYGCGHASGGPKGSGTPGQQNSNQVNIGGQGGSSGGTGSADQPSANVAASTTIQGDSAGLTGYGNYGGTGGGNNPGHSHGGGGGGGAGGVGANPSGGNSGAGGVGRVSNASGSPVYYAGGGGGSYHPPQGGSVGAGGNGGGTAGGNGGSTRSSAGTANTGGGTGCGGHPGGGAGTGGSGIIIVTI
tara:strand:+ start:560 stop:2200 length:1641 start_codon:yes stop_codon:yes gene_type:complete